MTVEDVTTVHELTDEDTIDSCDLIELRDKVRAWLDDAEHDADLYDEQEAAALVAAVDEFEAAGIADWQYGATFIRDGYFESYARQHAEDIGAVPDDAGWPGSHIDWPAAAGELKVDYTSVEVDGVTFWAR